MAYANYALRLANKKQLFKSFSESEAHFNTACKKRKEKNLMFFSELSGSGGAGLHQIKRNGFCFLLACAVYRLHATAHLN